MSRLQTLRRVVVAAVLAPLVAVIVFNGATWLVTATARACPFCSAQSMTFAEEMANSDVAVIARLIVKPAAPAAEPGALGTLPPPPAKSTFEIVTVLKGEKLLAGKKKFDILFFGQQEPGAEFLLFGIDPKELAWGTPTPLTEQGVKYLSALPKLPEAAIERLTFFQKYFEDSDPLLSSDAYNEFSKAPYSDIVAMKDRMQREKLLAWIKDPNVPTSRRRLYLTMLGVCGQPADVALLEKMIKDEDRQSRTALDAMIGCYLSLKGPAGLPLIEELFLKNDKADYVDTWSTIQALRVMGQETKVIPKERLVAALRNMLSRPQLADLVIPDLARWQDWSAMDRLVQLFKEADDETSFVRVPVVQFLRQCPDPKAKEYLTELAKIDPDAVKRAMNYLAVPPAATPAATAPVAKSDGEAPAETPAAPNAVLAVSGLKKDTPAPVATPGAAQPVAPPAADPTSSKAPAANSPSKAEPSASAEVPAGAGSTASSSASSSAAEPIPPIPVADPEEPSVQPRATVSKSTTAKSGSFDRPTRGVMRGEAPPSGDGPADEEAIEVAQVDPIRSSSPTPPINPPESGKMFLIGGLAVGAGLLLLLLVIVRGRNEPTRA